MTDSLNILLSILRDPERDNYERISAYKGIIYSMGMEGHPHFHPYNLDPDKPVEELVNWDWIESLEEGSGKEK